jgi:hypothetical protein
MAKELEKALFLGSLASLGAMALAAVTLKFPPGTRINWIQQTFGSEPPRETDDQKGKTLVVASNTTVNMGVVVQGVEYEMRVQDGGKVKGGSKAAADVLHVEGMKLVNQRERTMKIVPGVTVWWTPD